MKKTLAGLAVAAVLPFAGAAQAQELTFDIANIVGSSIVFDGINDVINFSTGSSNPVAPMFVITGASGIDSGSLIGLQGYFTTTGYSVSNIVSYGGYELADVGGTGKMTIIASDGVLTADLTFMDVQSQGRFLNLPFTTTVNMTNIDYTGSSNKGLDRMEQSAVTGGPDSSPSFAISSQFPRSTSLSQLFSKQGLTTASYSGSFYSAAPIPEPSTYAMLAVGLGMVGFSLARSRRA
jgi:hypothetical protein